MSWCFLHSQFVGLGCNGCKRDREMNVRRAPVKQPDGKWSDGINRSVRIKDLTRELTDPKRVYVWYSRYSKVWMVQRDDIDYEAEFAEHSDAIVAADKLARSMA